MPRQDLVKYRHGTAADWRLNNPVLELAEVGLETDTNLVKYGNGIDHWNDLGYPPGGGTSNVVIVDSLATSDPTKALAASQGPVISNSLAIANNASSNAVAAASAAATAANTAATTAATATATAATASAGVATLTGALTGKADKSGATFTGPVIVPTPTVSTHATTKAYVDSAVAGVNTGIPTTTTFATAIPFDGYRTMGETTVSGAIAFTVNSTGAIDAGETILSLVADGVHVPTFAAGINLAGTQGYDNTAGRVNNITFFRDFGRYYYGVVPGPIIAAPTLLGAAVSNSTPGRIDLTWSQPMSSTISAFGAFAVSAGHTLTAHTYVDSTHTYLTTSANFVNGETARTLSYTQPGSNKMMDLASGNLVVTFSGASITNNVSDTTAPTFVSAAVQASAPTVVEVNFSEALLGYPAGNLPAFSAFTVSGHTVSAIAWGATSTQIKLTVDTFVASETRTLAYTQPGTNNLSDSSANLVVNFSGQAITDNVVSTYLADNFNRADGAVGTSSHGEVWSTPDSSSSTFAINVSSNKAVGANNPGWATLDAGHTSYTISADIAPHHDTYLIFRGTTAAVGSDRWQAGFTAGGNFKLSKYISGAFTDLGDIGGYTVDGSVTYAVSVVVTPTTVTAKVNATTVHGPFTDSAASTQTRVGVYSFGTTSTIDNFLVTP